MRRRSTLARGRTDVGTGAEVVAPEPAVVVVGSPPVRDRDAAPQPAVRASAAAMAEASAADHTLGVTGLPLPNPPAAARVRC